MYRKRAARSRSNTLFGIILTLMHAASLAVIYVVTKQLVSVIAAEQVAFLYKFSVLIAIIPWCLKCGIKKVLHTKRIGLHFARGVFSIIANICFVFALKAIPTADAAVITFLEPLPTLLIGILYFKESITASKIVSVACGIVGALFVIQPGFNAFNSSYVFLLFALICWAINNSVIKILGDTEKTTTQLFYTTFFGSILSLPLTFRYSWDALNVIHFKHVVVLAVFHLIHVIAFFRAFKFADVSTIMPFDYTRLIFSGIFGYFILGEVPVGAKLLGYIFIVSGSLYLIYGETKKRRLGEKELKVETIIR
ncbi:S-adenosylmethionine uptake transporter [Alphaproteobacteria bacterium]